MQNSDAEMYWKSAAEEEATPLILFLFALRWIRYPKDPKLRCIGAAEYKYDEAQPGIAKKNGVLSYHGVGYFDDSNRKFSKALDFRIIQINVFFKTADFRLIQAN